MFSLDGLGLLGFESAIQRDYPVMFGTLYIFTLLGLLMQIVGDMLYTVVDPRIDFEAQAVDAFPASHAAGWRSSGRTGAAIGRSGCSWCCSASACSPNSSPTTGRC